MCLWLEHDPETEPLTVVTYGTSLTADGAWVDTVSTELEARYPGAATFVNAAESARHSVWGLANLDERVLSQAPDIAFLEFAVNDAYTPFATDVAASRANLHTLMDRIEAADPETRIAVIVSNHVIGAGAEARPALADYYQAWREIAVERGAVLIDEEPAWRLLLERDPDAFDRLVPDGLHPTYEGHDLVNRPLILDALEGVETDLEALVDAVINAG